MNAQRSRQMTAGERGQPDSGQTAVNPEGRPSMSSTLSSSSSSSLQQHHSQHSVKDWPQASAWRDMNARSAPFTIPPGRDQTSPTTAFAGYVSSQHASSPPTGRSTEAVPSSSRSGESSSFQRFAASPPSRSGDGRSPSPSKRGPFSFGNDARDRWSTLRHGQQNSSGFPSSSEQSQSAVQQHNKMIGSSSFGAEPLPLLGYSDLWGHNGGNGSQQHETDARRTGSTNSTNLARAPGPSLEQISNRFENMALNRGGGHSAVEEENEMFSNVNGSTRPSGQEHMNFHSNSFPLSNRPGNLSPRSLMQYHQHQHQHQHAAHSIMPSASGQQPSGSNVGIGGMMGGNGGGVDGARNGEEITTVFIVGFPDDMTEREFANMFLFAKGFEASTLKIPAGMNGTGSGGGSSGAGPGGPYNAVNVPISGLFEQQQNQQAMGGGVNGSWDEHGIPMGLGQQSTAGGEFGNGPPGAMGPSGVLPGKIKQTIGFAKFRTRVEALEARDALNGRKIDSERGCVLKTEMAKKNLHTKQRPVLSVNAAGGDGALPGSTGAAAFPGVGQPHGPSTNAPPPPPGFLPPPLGNMPMPPPPHANGGPNTGLPPQQHGGPGFGHQVLGVHPMSLPAGAGPGVGLRGALGSRSHDGVMLSSMTQPSNPSGPHNAFTHAHHLPQEAGQHASNTPGAQNFDAYHAQHNGSGDSNASAGPNGLSSPSGEGGRGYVRGAPQSFGIAAGGQSSESSSGTSDKWSGLGPLDYHEANVFQPSARKQQPPVHHQSQAQQQETGPSRQVAPSHLTTPGMMLPSRGPEWSTFGSPPGIHPNAVPISFGEIQSQQSQPQQQTEAQQHSSRMQQQRQTEEDFHRGESTAVALDKMVSSSSSPLAKEGRQVSPQLFGTEKSENSPNDHAQVAQQHQQAKERPVIAAPVAAHAGDGASMPPPPPSTMQTSTQSNVPVRPLSRISNRATSPPISGIGSSNTSRFGPLRIDSPMHTQRPFSPHALMRSPPPLMENGSLHFRATSPGSPSVSSPTSRSFSIDANPPGNTLFVGNLPASITAPPASTQLEDLLYKAFSAKHGFRQMSFRVKGSGPMCFIEFDDVGCAGRALGELNGDTLDGIVKGGLRLSFSKHPLFKGTTSAASSQHGGGNAAAGDTQMPAANGVAHGVNGISPNGAQHDQTHQQQPTDGGKQQSAHRSVSNLSSIAERQTVKATFDVEEASTLEETSYRQGYSEGEAHGKLHGLFEGRQLGVEKGFELWQELGYMEAVGQNMHRIIEGTSSGGPTDKANRKRQKQLQQLNALLAMIRSMPMDNSESVDIGATMERIRAKYKLACYSLDIAPDHQTPHSSSTAAVGAVQLDAVGAADVPSSVVKIKGRTVDTSRLHF